MGGYDGKPEVYLGKYERKDMNQLNWTRSMLCISIMASIFFTTLYVKEKKVYIKEAESLRSMYHVEKAALEVQTEKVIFYEQLLERVFGSIPQRTYSTKVTVTAYSAREIETNSEPWITADLSPSRVGMLAVSRDILAELGIEYGDTVILEGYGVFKVHDTMHERWKRRVDILMAHPKSARNFGKRNSVEMTWIK